MNVRYGLAAFAAAAALGSWIATGLGGGGIASAGGGGCHGDMEREAEGTRVELRNNCFSPTVLNVQPGDTVTFENVDDARHDIAGPGGAWGLHGEPIGRSQTLTMEFTEPGLYPYSCYLHYGMTGVISVGDDRSVAGPGRGVSGLRVSSAPLTFGADDQPAEQQAASSGSSEGGQMGLMLGGAAGVFAVVVGGLVVWRRRFA